MPDTNVILDHLLPADAVQLGNLITSVKYPEHDFCPADQHPANAEITSTQVLDFTYSAEKLKDTGFHAALTILLSGSQNRKEENRINISSTTCVTRQLCDSSAFFETLCQSRRARAWLERAIRKRQTVYFVTGVKTVTDAKVGSEKTKGGDVSADVTLPIALIASSGAGVPLSFDGGALNAGTGVTSSRSTSEVTSFTAPGEKIFAIQCRKIRFSFLSSRDADNAALADGAQWSIFLGERGKSEVDEETVNAALSESVQKEDLRGGKYETLSVDGEVFIYASNNVSDKQAP